MMRSVFYHSLVLETTSGNTSQRSHLVREIHHYDSKKKVFDKLCYCGQSCTRIPETLIKLYGSKVQSLDLSYNDIITLKGLEHFSDLKELILDNNKIGDSLQLPGLPKLHTLSLNKNQICALEPLLKQIKERLPSLTYLSLLGNEACPNQLSNKDNDEEDYQRYRHYVIHRLPQLKFLDANIVKEEERVEARNRGMFMNIVSPALLDGSVDVNINLNISGNLKYSPLPKALRSPEDYKGAYGKCRYRYSGKHSEGNRFISNSDL
ncbi:leucine-rich melanocyte differentiation-associated protein-like isoform X1 [Euwallacea similis]|uniref:leucine-rich melanocyte differentiation-associated protein-like isoform X1 n=1 Tax=Euwallacea similis TaxID=1736056 RepID=UPI00345094E2